MKKLNKFITSVILIAFISMISNPAYAEDTPPDYEHVDQGQCVTRNGFLFSEDGMAHLYVSIEEKIKLAGLEKEKELKFCKVDLDKCSSQKAIELRIQKEMFERQLKVKQESIDALNNEAFWNNMKGIGGIVLGLGVGFLVFKLTSSK